MLKEIKKELISNPKKIKEVLEYYGYSNIVIRDKYMKFGRDEYSSKNGITIHFEDNEYLNVKDWSKNFCKDLINFICTQRNADFSDVMGIIRKVLGIEDYYNYFDTSKGIFGGIYEKIQKNKETKINAHEDSILDRYSQNCNLRFLQDNISLSAQRYFDIRYDVESQTIVIPIRDQFGQLVGVKARCNFDVSDGEQKYFYLVPCAMSQQLYGYCQNYRYLQGSVVYIVEAEKGVLQGFSYGYRNIISLGSGSISSKQAKMIIELNPERVVFLHDVGFSFDSIERNIKILRSYSRFCELEIGYWDNDDRGYADKVSSTDMGKQEFERIIIEEIKII